jgi:hypothetical protein
MTTDLERVLGYQDAQNDDGDIVQVAENILMMPFWTPDMCQAVINAAADFNKIVIVLTK